MNSIEMIESRKAEIIPELYKWASTFDCEVDEEGESTDVSFDTICSLATRLKDGICTADDYIDIEFHIFQINYNEIIIDWGYPSGLTIHIS